MRFQNKAEYEKNRARMTAAVVEEIKDRSANICKVKSYLKDERLICEQIGQFSYKSLKALQEVFGEENVKFVSDGFECVSEMEFTPNENENVERIADALERIASLLERGVVQDGE